jgi:hypothetical protein
MKSVAELHAAVVERCALAPATPAERHGTYFRVSRIGTDGAFDYEERHYMQPCRCRVINDRIVTWCTAHDAYYKRVLSPDDYRPADAETESKRWNGVVEH